MNSSIQINYTRYNDIIAKHCTLTRHSVKEDRMKISNNADIRCLLFRTMQSSFCTNSLNQNSNPVWGTLRHSDWQQEAESRGLVLVGSLIPALVLLAVWPGIHAETSLFLFPRLRCWRRLLRVSWTARRSHQSILKEINPEYSLEGLMLKLKLHYFGHLTDLKRPWCWERLKAGREGDDRGWDGWMASPTQWTWVWVSSGSWWWTGRPGVLQSMGLQRVGHD